MWRYNLTVAGYNAICRAQQDACGLCEEEFDYGGHDFIGGGGEAQLHIDHDHGCCDKEESCGECVRGFLCRPCNMVRLPAYERLPDILRDSPRFNEYLSNPPARRPEAQVTDRDCRHPRGTLSKIMDAFFAAS
ncbi:endonuclease domain-containing protein [Streptomyces griseoruber]|uniref:endonuclease domain-containing protein n=1 Tax=Streptomyces griseoruber TaxID=1943 RepID=UPI000B00619D